MAQLLLDPHFSEIDDNGDPLSGGLVYTYENGTTTDKATYKTATLAVAHANPVVLDTRGEELIYLSGIYTIIVKDSDGVLIWTADNVEGQGSTIIDFHQLSEYADLATAVTTIGVTETTLYIDADDTMGGNITIPATLSLIGMKGHTITTTGWTITINGSYDAGNFQGFAGSGTVTFANGTHVKSSWFPDINTALTSLGTTQKIIFRLTRDETMTAGDTLPDNIVLEADPDCMISAGAAYTLAVEGLVNIPPYQWVSTNVTVTLTGDAISEHVFPEWWGATADNSTNNTTAIQAAITACPTGGVVYFSTTNAVTGGYITDKLTINKPMTLAGGGRGSILKALGAATGYILNVDGEAAGALSNEHGATFGQLYGVTVRDLHLDGNSRGASMGAIYQRTAEHCKYENLWIEDFQREGFKFARSNRETFVNNVWIRWCANKTGDWAGYPAINLFDTVGGGNDTNNGIYFDNLNVVYPMGDFVWMDTANAETYNVRHIVFSNCYFHGIYAALTGAGNNPFDTTFSAAQIAFQTFCIGTAEYIYITDSMFTGPSGYEVPGVEIDTGTNGAPVDIRIENCYFSGRYNTGADPTKDIIIHLKAGDLALSNCKLIGTAGAGASMLTTTTGQLYYGEANTLSGTGPDIAANTVQNPRTASMNVPMDLSGAAVTSVLMRGLPRGAHMLSCVLIWTEAASADAGITIEVGKDTDRNYYYTGTSLTTQALWTVNGLTLLKHDIAISDVLTVYSPGGKTGTGEAVFFIEYITL